MHSSAVSNFSSVSNSNRLCLLPDCEFVGSAALVLDNFPEVNIHCDLFNIANAAGSSVRSPVRNVMIPVNESDLKRITRTFFENGLLAALNEARNAHTTNPIISQLAEYMHNSLSVFERIKQRLWPCDIGVNAASLESCTETRNWSRSPIRCIAWHPNCFKFAVAGLDDGVRVYSDKTAIVPLLKAANQKWITSMAWRPYSAAELVVGCEQGLSVWHIDSNNMNITRNSTQAAFLTHGNHAPILAVQWSACGTLLASSSIGDKNVIIWNMDRLQQTPLRCIGLPCSVLKWSPDGSCLFSGTVGNKFRVWNTENQWVPQRYHLKQGSVQSACWSPCSSFLLFVTTNDELLYRLELVNEHLYKENDVIGSIQPIANLAKIHIGNREIGGKPQSLAWDPTGCFLAVTFKDSSSIAIFETVVNKFNLSISAAFIIPPVSAEYPSCICFQSKYRKNAISVLTIGWSSGRIQYFPFLNVS